MKHPIVRARSLGLLLALLCTGALAQNLQIAPAPARKASAAAPAPVTPWPTKPVRLLIGFPPVLNTANS